MKHFLFYLFNSFFLASAGYLILDLFVKYPFASLYRMNMYHMAFPYQYILITCIVFAILARAFFSLFTRQSPLARIGITALIIILTIVISSPLGGMLWHFHDMQAGYWPSWWARKLFRDGALWGLECGWLIVLGSIPYNLFGVLLCHWINQHGAHYFAPIADKRTAGSSATK